MDDDTLEIVQFIYMAATAATFFFLHSTYQLGKQF